MKKQEVTEVSQKYVVLLEENSVETALEALHPLLSQKLPFPLLDHAGDILGNLATGSPQALLGLLDKIEATKTMGGYVIIGSALSCFIDYDLSKALEKAKRIYDQERCLVCNRYHRGKSVRKRLGKPFR